LGPFWDDTCLQMCVEGMHHQVRWTIWPSSQPTAVCSCFYGLSFELLFMVFLDHAGCGSQFEEYLFCGVNVWDYMFMKATLGTSVTLLPCDLEVMGSILVQKSFSVCGGRAVYIYPPQTPLVESLVHCKITCNITWSLCYM